MITLNEINLRKNKKLAIQGYTGFNRNRKNGHMGGVATYVADDDVDKVLKVSEGKDGNEYIITRHSQFVVPINVINIYGEVESRATNDAIETKWEEIMEEVVKIEARDEEAVLIGDMNKHLSDTIIKDNKKQTHGGKLLNAFLSNKDYVLVNATEKTVNGPYTRYETNDPMNDEKKSALDLVIVSKNL